MKTMPVKNEKLKLASTLHLVASNVCSFSTQSVLPEKFKFEINHPDLVSVSKFVAFVLFCPLFPTIQLAYKSTYIIKNLDDYSG